MAQIINCAPSPIHGAGVFALVDLKPGTKIISEEPLWAIDRATAFKASFPVHDNVAEMRNIMIESFRRSNPHYPHDQTSDQGKLHKNKIVSLCGGLALDEERPTSEDPERCLMIATEKLRQILILNGACESVQGPGPAEWVGVFERSSRINHSCAPNAVRATSTDADGKIHRCLVTVTLNVKKGSEILINYVGPRATSLDRQRALQSRWKFTCACELCSRPQRQVAASDKRRVGMDMAVELLKQADDPEGDDNVAVYLGWKELDVLAAREGMTDLMLYEGMRMASDAARRIGKFSLEVGLLYRMYAVSKTFDLSPEVQQTIRDRIEDSPRLARELSERTLDGR